MSPGDTWRCRSGHIIIIILIFTTFSNPKLHSKSTLPECNNTKGCSRVSKSGNRYLLYQKFLLATNFKDNIFTNGRPTEITLNCLC